MTLPSRILTILAPSRVSFCSRSIHYQLRQQGQDVTLVLVERTDGKTEQEVLLSWRHPQRKRA